MAMPYLPFAVGGLDRKAAWIGSAFFNVLAAKATGPNFEVCSTNSCNGQRVVLWPSRSMQFQIRAIVCYLTVALLVVTSLLAFGGSAVASQSVGMEVFRLKPVAARYLCSCRV